MGTMLAFGDGEREGGVWPRVVGGVLPRVLGRDIGSGWSKMRLWTWCGYGRSIEKRYKAVQQLLI